ncbi:hydrolase [Actinomycetes bacterium]|nr:bifunctional riboflavin kinase/FMN phosphatase [Actinomycetota bacterium]GDX21367.1 hydrolase [Actinomycetes bacterium]
MKVFFDAVFFDMDGLMVDSEPEWLKSESEITAAYGYQWQPEDQVACLGGPLSRVGQYMHQKCKQAETPDFFTSKLIEVQSERMRLHTPFMPGAYELVKDLQRNGVKTGLVSASPRIIVDAVLDNVGTDLFPFSISSDDVDNTKPHPDAYLKAAKLAKSDIANCLILEDSLTGVNAATSSGAWLVAVPHLVRVDESARVRVIRSLEQLNFTKLQSLYKDFSIKI